MDAWLVIVQPRCAGLPTWVGILDLDGEWGDGEVWTPVDMGIFIQSDLVHQVQRFSLWS